MKKWLAVMGILGLSVMTLAACGNKGDSKVSGEKQTITVATDSDTAPFTFKKGDDFKGYDIDLVKAVFKDSDKYEVKFVTTPFDSILTGVDSGRYQIAANDFNYNEERAQKYSFSDPISRSNYAIISAEGTKYTSLDDLSGKTTEVLPGTNYAQLLENGTTPMRTRHQLQSITLLARRVFQHAFNTFKKEKLILSFMMPFRLSILLKIKAISWL